MGLGGWEDLRLEMIRTDGGMGWDYEILLKIAMM
jgi:hypothetical protein